MLTRLRGRTPVQTRRCDRRSASLLSGSITRALKREAPIDIHPEVQEALASRRPVVALETALVTNGIAPPTNLEVARNLEGIVRAQGAIPATIGIVEGRIKIGLQDFELQRLADTERNKNITKVSRRDIGPVLVHKKDGGTTICGTLIFAHLAGIKVIATGGFGGVHRGGENSLDVSADLQELTKCPVGVVSCGVKSILDIGRTLEYLETLGVPVVTYGETHDFPAFYCGKSGYKTNWKINDPHSAAEILRSQWRLGMQNGTLFAAPIPDAYAAQGAEIQAAVDQAIRESEENGISKHGKDVTPWLLGRVVELTGGKSLKSNIALLENTAVIGGQIAKEYAKLEEQGGVLEESPEKSFPASSPSASGQGFQPSSSSSPTPPSSSKVQTNLESKVPAKVIVIGASAIDITARVTQKTDDKLVQIANTTAPGTVTLTVGGVARNIAEAAHRVLSSGPTGDTNATLLISPLGSDEFSPLLLREHSRLGMRSDGFIRVKDDRTAVCNLLLDAKGSLTAGVADMGILHNVPEKAVLDRLKEEKPSLLVTDGNLSTSLLSEIVLHYLCQPSMSIFFEPTSVSKSISIFPSVIDAFVWMKTVNYTSPITFASPNLLELSHMYREADSETHGLINHRLWWDAINRFNLGSEWRMDLDQLARQPACPVKDKGDLSFIVKHGVAQMAVNMLPFFQHLIIKCGDRGVIVAMRISEYDVKESPWSEERSNPHARYIVAKGIDNKEVIVLKHFPAIVMEKEEIVNVTGAGDSLVGVLCASIANDPKTFQSPKKLDAAINLAQEAAVLSLHSVRAVSPLLGNTKRT